MDLYGAYCHVYPLVRSIFSACHFMTSTCGRVPSQVPQVPYRLVVYIFLQGTEVDISYFPPLPGFWQNLRMSCLVAVFGWDMFSRLYTTYSYQCWRSPGVRLLGGRMPSGSLCAFRATKQTRGVR